jgi:hypothetical protein
MMSRWMLRAGVGLLALVLAPRADAAPLNLNHQGRIMDATGVPLAGSQDVVVSLYDKDVSGMLLWSEQQTLDFDNGYFAMVLGIVEDLDDDLFIDEDDLWVELTIGGLLVGDRQLVASVPFALFARNAGHAASADTADYANEAGLATEASYAESADFALLADEADHAVTADTADHALTADDASYADEAGEADHADEADHAATADVATTAVNVEGGVVNATEIRIEGNVVIDGDGLILVHDHAWADLVSGVPTGLDDGDNDTLGDLDSTCDDGQFPAWNATDELWECGSVAVPAEDDIIDAVEAGAVTLALGSQVNTSDGAVDISTLTLADVAAELAAGTTVIDGSSVQADTITLAGEGVLTENLANELYVLKVGDTLAGHIDMNTYNITGAGAVNGTSGSFSSSLSVDGSAVLTESDTTILRADGSVAMTGGLNMGDQSLSNVDGVGAASGAFSSTLTVGGEAVLTENLSNDLYVLKVGDTMAGSIDMNTYNITGAGAVNGTAGSFSSSLTIDGSAVLTSADASDFVAIGGDTMTGALQATSLSDGTATLTGGALTGATSAAFSTTLTLGGVGVATLNDIPTDSVDITGDTMTGDLTISQASANANLIVTVDDDSIATIAAMGSSSQGTGVIYAGQSSTHGGGFLYNGNDDPDVLGSNDDIVFFRRSGGTDTAVFDYRYNSSDVNFYGSVDVDGALSVNGVNVLTATDDFLTSTDAATYVLNTGDTITGDVAITPASGDANLTVTADASSVATISAMGPSGGQGTGVVYVGQSPTYGGGMTYNGDGTPSSVGATDKVTFFRTNSGTDTAVFDYANYSSTVNFYGNVNVDGDLYTDGQQVARITDTFETNTTGTAEATIIIDGVQMTSGRAYCNGASSGTITFDDAFTGDPTVIANVGDDDGSGFNRILSIESVTSTNFVWETYTADTGGLVNCTSDVIFYTATGAE